MERKAVGNILVEKYNVIGTRLTVYAALEPCVKVDGLGFSHSTIEHIDGVWYGHIGMGPLPKEIDDQPSLSDGRIFAFCQWYENECKRAHEAIITVFPEAVNGKKVDAEIEVWEGSQK